jgi:hypothetical protein
MSLLAREVLECLAANPLLYESLTWQQIHRFLNLSRKIWPEIIGTSNLPPNNLPLHASRFLASVLGLDEATVQLCWTTFRELILRFEEAGAAINEDDSFRIHGHENMIGRCRLCISDRPNFYYDHNLQVLNRLYHP